ncbi:MAG: hypothetical protein R3F61_13250 [Myxococcota bacterium]
MSGTEDLSRLLSGDVTPEERSTLEARLASDPALRRQLDALRDLVSDLEALPEAAPPDLDASVLARTEVPAAPSRGSRATVWMLAGLAAAALIAVALRPTPGVAQLLEGSERVEGHVSLLAGLVPVEVDGVAVITVEPAGRVEREWGAEDPMPKTAILSALAGAAVTVAVYEGRAIVQSPTGGDTVTLAAGESHTVGPRRVVRTVAGGAPIRSAGDDEAAHLQALEDENAALREELRAARFEGAVARGQLEAHQGAPIPWPDDIAEPFRPDAFEAGLRKALEAHPGTELVSLDCGEFPCVAILTGPAGHDGWQDDLQKVPKAFVDAEFPDTPIGMQMMLAARDDGAELQGAVGFSVMPEADGSTDPAVETRSGYRTRELLDGFIDR